MSRTKHYARKGLVKRKREGEADSEPGAKRHETTRPEQTTYDKAISMMDPSLISDHIAKAMRKHYNDSATIELEDRHIPTRAIRNTTSFSEPHIAKQLPKYLETFTSGKEEFSEGEVAAPHTLIITSSGIRAADLARELRVFAKDNVKVAKLFAKHMKMADTVAFVEKTKMSIAIGSPNRPKDLIEQDVLKLTKLKRILVDGSYVDEKKRTIFDLAEVFKPLIELLNIGKIKSRLGVDENAIEILVF